MFGSESMMLLSTRSYGCNQGIQNPANVSDWNVNFIKSDYV